MRVARIETDGLLYLRDRGAGLANVHQAYT